MDHCTVSEWAGMGMGGGERGGRRMREWERGRKKKRVHLAPLHDVAWSGPGVRRSLVPSRQKPLQQLASTVQAACGATRAVPCGKVRCGYPLSFYFHAPRLVPHITELFPHCFNWEEGTGGAERRERERESEGGKEKEREVKDRKSREEERGRRSLSPESPTRRCWEQPACCLLWFWGWAPLTPKVR